MKQSPIPLAERLEKCLAPPCLDMFRVQAKALARTLDEMSGGGQYFQDLMRELVFPLYKPEAEDLIRIRGILSIINEQEAERGLRLLSFLLLEPFIKTQGGSV